MLEELKRRRHIINVYNSVIIGTIYRLQYNKKYGGWRQLDEQRSSSYYFHWWKDLKLLNQQQHTAEIKSHIQWKVGCEDRGMVGGLGGK